jgi:hypothetical protein
VIVPVVPVDDIESVMRIESQPMSSDGRVLARTKLLPYFGAHDRILGNQHRHYREIFPPTLRGLNFEYKKSLKCRDLQGAFANAFGAGTYHTIRTLQFISPRKLCPKCLRRHRSRYIP